MSDTSTDTAAIYARVSTSDQDVKRQLDEARDHLEKTGVGTIDEYAEIVSGAADTHQREEYNRLLDAIEAGEYDLVVVHEISRLSRLGPTEIHEFIQHCLEHDTGVEALDVGIDIHVDDNDLQQTIYGMIARLMGDLAKIEHEQKLQRIRSGVHEAQEAGKWTGRPPAGFEVEEGYLRVDPADFLHIREALARVEGGEGYTEVADQTGVAESTLRGLEADRRNLYLGGEADDDRVDLALQDVRPLEDLREAEVDVQDLRDRVERLEKEVDL
jgi:DNA invertase Pin-like site-specific DNA recombinase